MSKVLLVRGTTGVRVSMFQAAPYVLRLCVSLLYAFCKVNRVPAERACAESNQDAVGNRCADGQESGWVG